MPWKLPDWTSVKQRFSGQFEPAGGVDPPLAQSKACLLDGERWRRWFSDGDQQRVVDVLVVGLFALLQHLEDRHRRR